MFFKLYLLTLLIASASFGQITCSTATVTATCPVATGQSVTLTSPSSGTWSLAASSVGTLIGTNPSTTITYKAPSSVAPTRLLFGCQVMPMDSIFNTRVDNLPVDPNGTTKITNAITGEYQYLTFQPSRGISYADSINQTLSTQISLYPLNGNYPGWVTPTNQYWHREGGRYVGLTAGFAKGSFTAVDFHTMTVEAAPVNTPPNDCSFFESYEQLLNGTVSAVCSGSGCTLESAANYPTASYNPLDYGTGAAGTPSMPESPTVDEIKSGTINHRWRMAMNGSFLSNTYRWPATATAGGGVFCDGGVGSGTVNNCIQLGDLYRLKAASLTSLTSSICTGHAYATECSAILTSWRNYGIQVDDGGTSASLIPSSDCSEDPNCYAALLAIQGANVALTNSNFELVDQGPLFNNNCFGYNTTASGLHGCNSTYGGNTYTGEQNTYETPNQLAVVCAGTCGGSTQQISVAIQPVAIGVAIPNLFAVQAGSYTWTIPYYVTGTVTKTATWSLSGCSLGTGNCGSVTSGGVYTPPTSLTTGTIGTFILTGTATADSASTIVLYPTLIPAPSGTGRIDLGSSSDTGPDGNGNYWTRDIGAFGVSNVCSPSASGCTVYPNYSNTDPLWQQLQSSDVVGGSNGSEDFHYYTVLPNGKYHVTVYETLPTCTNSGTVACGTWPYSSKDLSPRDIFEPTPLLININGQTMTNMWDWSYSTNYLFASNGNITVAANVTNNFLDVGVYPVAPDVSWGSGSSSLCNNNTTAGCVSPYTGTNIGTSTGNKIQFIAALQIAPTSDAISLSIDPARNTLFNNLVAAGGSSQPLYAVCNYFTCGSTTWSIVSSPICGTGTGQVTCTLTATAWGDGGEELSLGSGTVLGGQPIIVQAVNSGHTAQLKFLTSGPKFLTIP